MKKYLFPLLTLAVLATVTTRADDFKREQGEKLAAMEGKAAPMLSVTDWMNTPGNKALDLKSLHGKVVVIDFWGTW